MRPCRVNFSGLSARWDYQEFRARARFSSLADEPFAEDGCELGLGLEPLRGGRFHSSGSELHFDQVVHRESISIL
jgi:hypothetical protein